jgi:hypothetical protein
MASIKTYITQLQNRQQIIARKFGCDITRLDKQARVLNLSILALLAVLIKTLTDRSIITDAQLLATMDSARDDSYDDEPLNPPE